MNSQQADVFRFHKKHSLESNNVPTFPSDRCQDLRIALVNEEAEELCTAIKQGDMVEIADGLADLLYVTYGAALAFGIDLDRIFDVVHSNNMMKPEGAKDKRGKVLKKPTHVEPSVGILKVLNEQEAMYPRG